MYLRITKRTNKDGSVIEYFQLAHNERHPDTRKPVAKIIHNFGRVDQFDRQELVRLCQSIGRVCGLRFDDPLATPRDSAGPIDMYEAMDLLHANIEEVEKTVFFNTANLFNLEVDLIFYDTTTASFHVDYEDDDSDPNTTLRKFGHAKEGNWAPQVVVALAVTRDGIPVRSWVLPGNTADVTTVTKVRADLRGWNLGRAMFVADAGMNSTDNRVELAKACGKYHKRLMVIERCFRSLKRTQIKVTPMYHWVSRRIETHVKICVLALQIERVAEISCGKSWSHIKRALETLQVTEFFDLKYRLLMRNEVTKEAENILKSLKIKPPERIIHMSEQGQIL